MKALSLPVISALALLLAACQPQTAMNPAAPGCLQYAMGNVTLTGQAESRRISAPGKDYRQALVLVLDTPVCISARQGKENEFPAHQNVQTIELIAQSDLVAAHSLAGQRVSAHGSLSPLSGDGAAAPVALRLRTLKPIETPAQ